MEFSAEWAAVIVAFAAVLVAIVSIRVTKQTTRAQLSHARALAVQDTKRRAYSEALAHLTLQFSTPAGIDGVRTLERGLVYASDLELVGAPATIVRLFIVGRQMHSFVILKTPQRSAASADLSLLADLLRECML